MKQKLLLFSDSEEGQQLALALCTMPLDVTACVATGNEPDHLPKRVHICTDCQNASSITHYLQEKHFGWVIDATHPCATAITKEIRTAAHCAGVPYLRLLRSKKRHTLHYVSSAEQAANLLAPTNGKILLSVNWKEIDQFAVLPRPRLYVHTKSTVASLQACDCAGIPRSHIIEKENSFCQGASLKLFRQLSIQHLVTSNVNHSSSGFEDKMAMAEDAGVHVTVIGCPVHETGYRYGEILELLACELEETP